MLKISPIEGTRVGPIRPTAVHWRQRPHCRREGVDSAVGEPPEASSPGARAVLGELVLAYRLEERIPLDAGAPSRHVERWTVSVLLDRSASGDVRVEIGYAHVLVFTLEPGMDVGELADRASGTWIDVESRAEAPRLPADLGDDP